MSYVTLATAKKQLEVIHSADDNFIQLCLDAAESYAAEFMGRDGIYDGQAWRDTGEATSDASSDGDVVPKAVEMAILLIAADFHEHRTQTANGSMTKLPAAEQMLHFYRLRLGV
jgi:hypothetical protein